MPSEAKRVNITINEAAHERLRELVDSLYGGNFSRYVADAALFYAGALSDAGRRSVEAYVAARQAQHWNVPDMVTEKGVTVSVLMCSYCGNPNPAQLESISADTINLICPECGNEQVLKGFRPGRTRVSPETAISAYRDYYSGERSGALDPPAIDLVKRHFGPHAKAMKDFNDQEWVELIAEFHRKREQLTKMRPDREWPEGDRAVTDAARDEA